MNILKKVDKILKDNKGEMYVDLCIMVLVFTLLLVVVIKSMPAFVLKYELNTFVDSAVRRIEITGEVNNDVLNIIDELANMRDLDPEINIEAEYITSTKKIQIDGKITVIATHEYDIGFGPFGSFPVTLTSKAEGYSEVYFRE